MAGVYRAESAFASRHGRNASLDRGMRRRLVVERGRLADRAEQQQSVLPVVGCRERRRDRRAPDRVWSDGKAIMEPLAGRDERRRRIPAWIEWRAAVQSEQADHIG